MGTTARWQWQSAAPEAIAHAARRLLPDARLTRVAVLHAYDFYWYAHHEPRLLPILRVTFDDPQATWFHIDPVTGDVLERMDASRRWHRILFNALHSLDFPLLLAYRPAWDLVVMALCGLGLALSVTAVVIAWRRLRDSLEALGVEGLAGHSTRHTRYCVARPMLARLLAGVAIK